MTNLKNFYLERYAFTGNNIETQPNANLGIVVVIPCFNEPDVIPSLQSLLYAQLPETSVEVIIVINNAENASAEIKEHNLKTHQKLTEWSEKNSSEKLSFYPLLFNDLPPKHAGVGLARKIGMDEAVRRFMYTEKSNGIIVCFDSDSLCENNFLTEIEIHFSAQSGKEAFGIYFEHPLHGTQFSDEIYDSITLYELHLRYYINALKWAGLPSAYQTIGSSMAVRSLAYQKEGGMNKRKAGEDFYFLQKFIDKGTFGEIKTTKVIPSPRTSDRVPFGTGKAIRDHVMDKKTPSTYHLQTFKELKCFLDQSNALYQITEVELYALLKSLPASISRFLSEQNINSVLQEISRQSTNLKTFKNRFFRWFNAFMAMKFVHYSRDHFHTNEAIDKAAYSFLKEIKNFDSISLNSKLLLKKFREIDLID